MILKKDKLNDWISLLNKYALYAPIESNGVVLFGSVDNGKDVVLDRHTTRPPKELLFPQTETIFTFTSGKKLDIIPPVLDEEKVIIFGIRPCDARSFSILDHLFNGDFKDQYYLSKRNNTILVGLSCVSPHQNCFCTSLDGGPGSSDDVDVLMTDLGDGYYMEGVTDKGKSLIEESEGLLKKATGEDSGKKEEVIDLAEDKIKRSFDVEGVSGKLDDLYENAYWKEIARKCLGCGTCTYLCPTCHCFDIQDEVGGKGGRRIRIWDTCMASEYTLHASGYNPRPGRMNRIRNRVYHKYKYYPENFDEIACVGCGRCINECSVNMDIIDIISQIKEGVDG
jgi:ferredoxin